MRSLITTVATWAFTLGLIFTVFGFWEIYKERGVNQEARVMEIGKVSHPADELIYASISGGRLDVLNAYEYSLTTKKSGTKLDSTYYVPVLNEDDGSVVYILESNLEPTLEDIIKTASYSGLLKNKSELPEEILQAYDAKFSNAIYSYLDSTYEPKPLLEKIIDLKIFLYLLFGGLIVRIILNRKPVEAEDGNKTETA